VRVRPGGPHLQARHGPAPGAGHRVGSERRGPRAPRRASVHRAARPGPGRRSRGATTAAPAACAGAAHPDRRGRAADPFSLIDPDAPDLGLDALGFDVAPDSSPSHDDSEVSAVSAILADIAGGAAAGEAMARPHGAAEPAAERWKLRTGSGLLLKFPTYETAVIWAAGHDGPLGITRGDLDFRRYKAFHHATKSIADPHEALLATPSFEERPDLGAALPPMPLDPAHLTARAADPGSIPVEPSAPRIAANDKSPAPAPNTENPAVATEPLAGSGFQLSHGSRCFDLAVEAHLPYPGYHPRSRRSVLLRLAGGHARGTVLNEPRESTAKWAVRKPDGTVLRFPNLDVLQSWIREGIVVKGDWIEHEEAGWTRVEAVTELAVMMAKSTPVTKPPVGPRLAAEPVRKRRRWSSPQAPRPPVRRRCRSRARPHRRPTLRAPARCTARGRRRSWVRPAARATSSR
jgi:hypothetical protein